MNRHEVEQQTDREILVDVRMTLAVIDERTTDVPEMRKRITTVERDVLWIRRIAIGVGAVLAAAVGLLTKFKDLIN